MGGDGGSRFIAYGIEPGNLVVDKARVRMKIKTPVFHGMFMVLESWPSSVAVSPISYSHMTVYANMGSRHSVTNRT